MKWRTEKKNENGKTGNGNQCKSSRELAKGAAERENIVKPIERTDERRIRESIFFARQRKRCFFFLWRFNTPRRL